MVQQQKSQIVVEKVPAAKWREHFSESAHRAVFGKIKPAQNERIDYAWLAVTNNLPMCYVTVREIDHETVYWAYGGVFEWAQKSILAARGYQQFIAAQGLTGAKRILHYVEPCNVKMLRLALGHGFRVCGYRARGDINLVDMVLELT